MRPNIYVSSIMGHEVCRYQVLTMQRANGRVRSNFSESNET